MKKRILVFEEAESGTRLLDTASRLSTEVRAASSHEELLQIGRHFNPDLVLLDTNHSHVGRPLLELPLLGTLHGLKAEFLLISERKDPEAVIEAKQMGARDFIPKPFNLRELIARLNASLQRKKRIVCLGGGTGLFTVLMGLKKIPNILLTSIVSMSDDGGSSGKLRASFGILPPGDIRRSLVGLSNAPEEMNQLIKYRFKKGEGLEDHSLGNLLLTALAEIKGNMCEAVRTLGDILNIQGIVLPATATLTDLVARFEDGTVVRGESKIDLAKGRDPNLRIVDFSHDPRPDCNLDAYASIIFADLITIGPGDLFTSVIANISVPGIRDALVRTRAEKAYFCNVMTKPGETSNYTASEHVKEIIQYLKGDFLDYVFLSNTQFSSSSISEYALKGQVPVLADSEEDALKAITKAQVILADLAHEDELVRHDSEKIKVQTEKLLKDSVAIRSGEVR